MPKTKAQEIRELLTRRSGYADISPEDLKFDEETKAKIDEIRAKAIHDSHYQDLLNRYNDVEELIEENTAMNYSDLTPEERDENLSITIPIMADMRLSYMHINPFTRFFSHFVPETWTETGRLRKEIRECEETFEELGFTEEVLEDYAERNYGEVGETIKEAHEIQKIYNRHWFKSGVEKEMREYSKKYIADAIDLPPLSDDEDSKEPMVIDDLDEDELEDEYPDKRNPAPVIKSDSPEAAP